MAQIIERCSTAPSLDKAAERSDALFIGSDTPWVTAPRIRSLSRLASVFGVVAGRRDPVATVFENGGAAMVIDESAPPTEKLLSVLGTSPVRHAGCRTTVISVTGPRGAPGRSEVAFTLAWMARTKTLLAELDHDAPGVGIRCGLGPTTDLRSDLIQTASFEHMSVFAPPLGGGPLSKSMTARLLDAARSTHETIVLDVGPSNHQMAGVGVVVCDPTPTGIVRCARFLDTWHEGRPFLVVNRVTHDLNIPLIRRATGLEPAAYIPVCEPPQPGEAPPPAMVDALQPLVDMVRAGFSGREDVRPLERRC
jgi:hypothetical protein